MSDPLTAVWGLLVLTLVNLTKDLIRGRSAKAEVEHHQRICATREEVRLEMEQALKRRDEEFATKEIRDFIKRQHLGEAE